MSSFDNNRDDGRNVYLDDDKKIDFSFDFCWFVVYFCYDVNNGLCYCYYYGKYC